MLRRLQITFLWMITGLWAFSVSAGGLELSPAEQSYLQEQQVISMCVDPNWLPYEKLDSEGEHIGLVAKYITLFQSKLGTLIKAIKTNTWQQSQKLYEDGLCDIVSALNKTPERAQYLAFTQPYIESPAVLILNEKNLTDSALADLDSKTLAMVKGYVYESKLREDYPNIEIVYVPDMEVALQKVSSGQITATLGPLFMTFAMVQELNLDNLTVVGNTEYRDELRIGINKNNKILIDIMDKTVASLTAEDHSYVRRIWAVERKL
jgi:ABC-type amino acid transport substrate-binding protein